MSISCESGSRDLGLVGFNLHSSHSRRTFGPTPPKPAEAVRPLVASCEQICHARNSGCSHGSARPPSEASGIESAISWTVLRDWAEGHASCRPRRSYSTPLRHLFHPLQCSRHLTSLWKFWSGLGAAAVFLQQRILPWAPSFLVPEAVPLQPACCHHCTRVVVPAALPA